jgi:DNA-binding MarR family transcriptional regulator
MYDKEKKKKMMLVIQRMNPDIEPEALQLMDRMRYVAHALRQIGESSLVAADMSYARYRLLWGLFLSAEVEDREGLNPSEISDRQGTSRNTISALIRELEEEGLIERHLDKEDRRKFKIQLSPSGLTIVKEHSSKHMRMVAQCFESLTAEEREQLGRILDKLGENLERVRDGDS